MAIKIDLEKAFDRMEWSFIKVNLEHFLFPPPLIKIIMACISSSSISILLNGGMLEPFRPSRGLRQGDPLSPYILSYAQNFLGSSLMNATKMGEWKPLKSSRSGTNFSYLFFIDDLVLFVEAILSTARAIEGVLEKLCYSSSQKVSFAKSTVFFPLTWIPLPVGISAICLTLGNPRKLANTQVFPLKPPLSRLVNLTIWLRKF